MITSTEWLLAGIFRASIGLTVAALLVAACVWLLRLRSPRAEQWAWLLVLAQGLVLIPLTLPAPRWLAAESKGDSAAELADTVAEPVPLAPAIAATPIGIDQEPHSQDSGVSPSVVTRDIDIERDKAPSDRSWNWPAVGVATWLSGIAACIILGGGRYGMFLRRLQSARPATGAWQVEWQEVLDAEQIRVKVPLLVSRDMGPALFKTWRGYGIVVPEPTWSALSSTERVAILRHEAAHLRRGDLWRSLAARCLAVMHWFNPAAWWAAARFEAQSEFLCDRVAACQGPIDYATTLVRLAARRQRATALVQWMSAGSLVERTQRLVDRTPAGSAWRSALPVALTVVALAGSGLRLRAVGDEPSGDATIDSARDGAESPSLPPRALVRLGANDLLASGAIRALAFSPDGKQVAAAPMNTPWPSVPIFDMATRRRVRLLSDPANKPGWVSHLAFSPDGEKVLGSTYSELLLWDLKTGKLLFRETVHAGEISDVKYSPDGRLVGSAGSDGTLQLRSADDPAVIVRKVVVSRSPAARDEKGPGPAEGGGLSCFAFTPDGSRMVAGIGRSGDISIWRVADGERIRVIPQAHGGGLSYNPRLNCLAVSSDGRYFMSSGQHTVTPQQTTLKYVPKNVTLTEVRLWDLQTGERLRDLAGKEDYGFGYAGLSPDSKRVAIADFGRLTIRDTATGKVEQKIALPGSWGQPPVFTPNGKIVALPLNNRVGLFDVQTGHRLPESDADPTGSVASVAWSAKGDRIGTGHQDGFIRLWNATTGTLVWKHELAPVISASGWPANPAHIAFSPDGRQVIVAGRRDDPIKYQPGIVAVLDAETGNARSETYLDEIRGAALSPDGERVIAATNHGGINQTRLHGIDIAARSVLYTRPPQEVRVALWDAKVMRFQPDSKTMWLASGDGGIAQFEAATGKEVRKFVADWRTPEQITAGKPREPQLWEAAFSADCQTLVSSSAEYVYVWDMATGQMRLRIRHPHDHGCKICLAPDGKMMATSDLNYAGDPGENTVSLYELETGKVILSLDPGEDRAGVLAFSPDGSKLFTGFHRGTALIWDVRR